MIKFLTVRVLRIFAMVVFLLGGVKPSPSEVDLTEKVNTTSQRKDEETESEKKKKVWKCTNCTTNEGIVLTFLQECGIEDKTSLSVLMGNIKQESRFHSNICEGGARVPYEKCYTGGYGLVQWTTKSRYGGLGTFAKSYGGDPSSIDVQLKYMVTEVEWKKVENVFKTPNLEMYEYMDAARMWLRWGVYGNREVYTRQYMNRLILV